MSIHHAIQNYINDLQALLNETTEQALIDKARDLWKGGQDDPRFTVLEHFLESDRFSKPAKPPAPESDQGGENKSVK